MHDGIKLCIVEFIYNIYNYEVLICCKSEYKAGAGRELR
jgi:hypothetical protein